MDGFLAVMRVTPPCDTGYTGSIRLSTHLTSMEGTTMQREKRDVLEISRIDCMLSKGLRLLRHCD
jgi:hypothetical protein